VEELKIDESLAMAIERAKSCNQIRAQICSVMDRTNVPEAKNMDLLEANSPLPKP
jgi:hypothetical protein